MPLFLQYLLLIFVLVVNIFLLLCFIGLLWSAKAGAPFVPTNRKIALQMIEIANIQKGEKVYDLGSGDGRLVFLAAEKGADAVGIEISPLVYWWAKLLQKIGNHKGTLLRGSIWDIDMSDADAIFLYLLPGLMKQFDTDIYPQLPSGARIIAHGFELKNHTPIKKWQPKKGERGKLFVYQKK